ncbi:hypothetical protein [Nocardioides solisilvae]|uniref:hypothetical protein n=1 Tax=Nocardioides solisilvae TaxID=1542435 RepID=UPI000D74E9E9|nr:hypothetical protein [Nocardioides solisilvae]
MVAPGAWGRELLALRLAQPDRRSCGAAVLVVAEALANPRYARWLIVGGAERVAGETLAMHRRVTGPVDVAGRLQPPWPRSLGTPPWAVARQLTARTGVRHTVRWARGRRGRRRAWEGLVAALEEGRPVPVYVGSRALPRHVLLALVPARAPRDGTADGPLAPRPRATADSVRVHDPATGGQRAFPADRFRDGALGTGWPRPWFVVLPATARAPGAGSGLR